MGTRGDVGSLEELLVERGATEAVLEPHVAGENDRIIPPVYAEDFAKMIPGSQVSVLSNAGHLLMIERAEVFASAVADFLS